MFIFKISVSSANIQAHNTFDIYDASDQFSFSEDCSAMSFVCILTKIQNEISWVGDQIYDDRDIRSHLVCHENILRANIFEIFLQYLHLAADHDTKPDQSAISWLR